MVSGEGGWWESQTAKAPDGRRLHFDLESWAALSRYLAAREDPAGYPLLLWHLPLFGRHDPASVGRPLEGLTAESAGRVLRWLAAGSGVGARDLRTRFGNRVLAATLDEVGTGELLGVKQLASVRRYWGERD